MRKLERSIAMVVALAASVLACEGEDAGAECQRGGELCECYPNRTCDSGLICSGSDICVEDDPGSGGGGNSDDGGSGGSSDAGGSDGATGNTGGSSDTGGSGGSGASGSGGASGGSGDSGGDAGANDTGGASTTGEDSTNSTSGGASGTNGGAGGTTGAGGSSDGTTGDTTSASGGGGGTTDSTSTSSGGTTGETRTELVPVDGWVDGSTNDVGIQGSWYTYADALATIVPAGEPFFDGMGSEICISGTTVPDEYSGVYWGVAVGMDFNVVDEMTYAYNATSNGVVGIRLTLTGSLPPGVQFNLTMTTSSEDDTYCSRYTGITGSSKTLSFNFAETRSRCWEGAAGLPIDRMVLKTFSIQVMSAAYESIPFDFCVENVSAILE